MNHDSYPITMNAINVIKPYLWEGLWGFDDPAVGLDKEPFVSGADRIIDRIVEGIPGAENGFRLIFSSTPFPGHTHRFERRHEESGGHWYYSPEFRMEGWLCPALFRYFEEAPGEIFAKAEPSSDRRPDERPS